MSDTRISAADLLRLVTIASVSPEGTADEVVAILQRTGPAEVAKIVPITAEQFAFAQAEPAAGEAGVASAEDAAPISGLGVQNQVILGDAAAAARAADSDKLAKPE